MEIVKIGEKTWQNAVIHLIHQTFSPPMFFTVQYIIKVFLKIIP